MNTTGPERSRYGTIYLVRHGQTALNAAGVLRGRLDPALDETGEQEAIALGKLFAGVLIDAIISSPLQRARATAQPIADATGAPLDCHESFIDRDYGAWAGKDAAEASARYGSIDRAPGVEPMGSVISRAVFGARALASGVQAVVIVSHDIVNRALLARLASNTPMELDAIPQRTGSWNQLEHHNAKWVATVIDAIPGRRAGLTALEPAVPGRERPVG